MFVTNWISTTKIQKISEITNFFRHYFLSRTEVFIMCYHANILEHLPNSIFEFCSNFAVYIIIRYLFLDLCFYKKKTVHIDELQDCCETGLIVHENGA